MDAMSTSARVSSKGCKAASVSGWRAKKGRTAKKNSGRCLSIALHPKIFLAASARKTDDSGQALDLIPQPARFSYRSDFGGQQRPAVAFGWALADFARRSAQKECPFRSGA